MRTALVTAAFAAAVVVFAAVSLPPATRAVDHQWDDGSVAGAFHVHSNRSDGRSAPDDIAAAAARAGLKFVVFTDHGDGTRTPDPPVYRSGVLCLDAVEISTSGGHYIALDMTAAAYPLAGEPRDVVEDVRRLGGFGIAAHPDSPKRELQWSDWGLPIDGLELINPDTSWRAQLVGDWRSRIHLLRGVLTYPVRAPETIGELLTDSDTLADRWTDATERRRVVGLAGVDAHAKLELKNVEPGDNRYSLPIPSYEASFRALSIRVGPATSLTGEPVADAKSILHAMRGGHLYATVDAWATPPAFEFSADNGSGTATSGDILAPAGAVTLRVRSNAPAGFVTTVFRGSEAITRDSVETDLTVSAGEEPAVYRVEIRRSDRPNAPAWIIGNPIYVRTADPVEGTQAPAPATEQLSLFDGRSTAGWSRENDEASLAAIEAVQMTTATELRLRYGMAGGSAVGQYSGAAVETSRGLNSFDRVAFTGRAEHPMRISIQVRAEVKNAPPERWQRSIYLDATDAEHRVSFDDMRPVGITHAPRPPREDVRAIMFIVDTTNSKPGASGRIWLKNVRLER